MNARQLLLLLTLIPCILCSCAKVPQTRRVSSSAFYVATNGNDAWSGKLAAPNRGRTDGPFASLGQAISAARQNASGSAAGQVVVRDGLHGLSQTLILQPEDSGLQVSAYPGEKPVLSGGQRITGWQETRLNGHTVWAAPLPSRPGPAGFHELWVNGARVVRARHPNQGYLPVDELLDKTDGWMHGQSRFRFKAGDLQNWSSLTNAEVMVMTRWVESRLPITSIDTTQKIVSFSKRSVFALEPGDLYYVEGATDLLDQPGEWALDNGRVLYSPKPGERIETAQAIAPALTQLIRFEGTPGAKPIQNVQFKGITFSHTEWCFPEGFQKGDLVIEPAPKADIGGFAQAAFGVPAAIFARGLQNSVFENCRFVQVGNYGMELERGCSGNKISGCEFAELGAGGIKIGESAIRTKPEDITTGNEVSDCHIHDGGRMFHSAIGVWIGQSPNNRILRNHIHDFYYTGISVGWTWGYDPSALATNTLVAFNHVHHIGVLSDGDGPILSDMAGIYTLGKHTGSVIHNNLWHDVAGIRYGGWGIYFDEGTTGIKAVSNVVYRTTHGGFHQHYGATNTVRNNVFAFARDYQVQRSRKEDHISFFFQTNIVLFDKGVLYGGTWDGDRYENDYNLFLDYRTPATPSPNLGADTWDKWTRRGHDQHSIWADPLFVSPRSGDFRLQPASPASKIGFQPIVLNVPGLPAGSGAQTAAADLNTPRKFPNISSASEWKDRAQAIREQVLFSCGLYPAPEKTPLNARVFDRTEHGDYSVEKVYFQSYPGFYVAGNLYRPLGKGKGPFPGILNPHGHSDAGRLTDTKVFSTAARCINFARAGMVAFSWDMVGYNDTSFPEYGDSSPGKYYTRHRRFGTNDFLQLWNISLMGLQTWNSIRSLDFLESLPDVDKSRLACTGESGGGTQTFMLGAADGRLAAQAPVNMVSHSMQGGCSCENVPGLRVEYSNMEIAAAPAPRPQLLVSATGDWTKTTLTLEGPAVESVYRLVNAPDHIKYVQYDFPHNYNQSSREAVYGWFNKWLLKGSSTEPIPEKAYEKDDDSKLRVFPGSKLPGDAVTDQQLTSYLIASAEAQLDAILPTDSATLRQYKSVMMPAWRHALQLDGHEAAPVSRPAYKSGPAEYLLTSATDSEGVRVSVRPAKRNGKQKVAIIAGTGEPSLESLLTKAGYAVIRIVEWSQSPNADPFQNFFTTYNRTLCQQRVRDIVRTIGFARKTMGASRVMVAGTGQAGFWSLLASPAADGVIADANRLDTSTDQAFLQSALFTPGLRRIGGLEGVLLLAAPNPVLVYNTGPAFASQKLQRFYTGSLVSRLALESSREPLALSSSW